MNIEFKNFNFESKQDKFLQDLYNLEKNFNEYTIQELKDIFNCNEKTIRNRFKKYNILKAKSKIKSKLSPNNEIENLLNEGFSSSEIANKLNLNVRQITCYRNSKNLGADNNNIKRAKSKIILSNIEEQVIIGSLLGDGSIDKHNNYYRLIIKHGEKQKDYIYYKYNLLKRFSSKPSKNFRIDNREKFKDHIEYTLRTTTNSIFEEYRKNWYPDNKKIIYRPDFVKIKPLGFAIWLMDDGYKSGNSIAISTDCFSINDLEFVCKFFKDSYNFDLTIQSPNRLYIRSNSMNIIKEKIRKCFPESMLYKLRSN
jgi:DNA-binding CsgD family transcriptional regulator